MNFPNWQWINGLGSIGTAIAAVIALFTFVHAINTGQRQLDSRDAMEIRHNLVQFAQESDLLTKRLGDGSALIMGAASIVEELENRLGSSATRDDFMNYFRKDRSTAESKLSVAVVGWTRSDLSKELDRIRESYIQSSSSFDGYLSVLRKVGELNDKIMADSYSALIFTRVLELNETMTILNDKKGSELLPGILDALRNFLSSHAKLYYIKYYEKASKKIDKFIQEIVESFTRLSDKDLIELSREAVTVSEETKTEEMRTLLRGIKPRLENDRYESLLSIITSIEEEFKKEKIKEEPEL